MSNPEDLNEHSVDEIYNHLIKDLDYNLNERPFPMDGISCITNTTIIIVPKSHPKLTSNSKNRL